MRRTCLDDSDSLSVSAGTQETRGRKSKSRAFLGNHRREAKLVSQRHGLSRCLNEGLKIFHCCSSV